MMVDFIIFSVFVEALRQTFIWMGNAESLDSLTSSMFLRSDIASPETQNDLHSIFACFT